MDGRTREQGEGLHLPSFTSEGHFGIPRSHGLDRFDSSWNPDTRGEMQSYSRIDPFLRKAKRNEVTLVVASGKAQGGRHFERAGRASVRRRPFEAGIATGGNVVAIGRHWRFSGLRAALPGNCHTGLSRRDPLIFERTDYSRVIAGVGTGFQKRSCAVQLIRPTTLNTALRKRELHSSIQRMGYKVS